eukprot:g4559.t1
MGSSGDDFSQFDAFEEGGFDERGTPQPSKARSKRGKRERGPRDVRRSRRSDSSSGRPTSSSTSSSSAAASSRRSSSRRSPRRGRDRSKRGHTRDSKRARDDDFFAEDVGGGGGGAGSGGFSDGSDDFSGPGDDDALDDEFSGGIGGDVAGYQGHDTGGIDVVANRARQHSNMVAQRRSRSVQVHAFCASVTEASVGGSKAVPFGQFHISCELICTTANSLDKKYTRWMVRRRYREFGELDRMLRKRLGWRIEEVTLPGRGVPSKIDDAFLEERRTLLDAYLKQLQKIPGVSSFAHGHLACEELSRFLDFERRGFAAGDADNRARANFPLLVLALALVQLALAGYNMLVRQAQPDAAAGDGGPGFAAATALVLCAAQAVATLPVALLGAWCVDGCVTPTGSHLSLFAALGFCGTFANTLLFIAGLFLASPVVAALFLCNTPVWTIAAAHALGIEAQAGAQGVMRPASRYTLVCAAVSRAVGLLLSLVGSAVVFIFVPRAQLPGVAMLALSCLCTVAARLLHRRYFSWLGGDGSERMDQLARYPEATVWAWAHVFGALFALLSLLYFVALPPEEEGQDAAFDLTRADVQLILFGVLVARGVVSTLTAWIRSRVSDYVIFSFLPVQVIVTVLFSFTLFGEMMTPHEGAAGACIILGLLMVCLATHRQEMQMWMTRYSALDDEDEAGGFGIQDTDLFERHAEHEDL